MLHALMHTYIVLGLLKGFTLAEPTKTISMLLSVLLDLLPTSGATRKRPACACLRCCSLHIWRLRIELHRTYGDSPSAADNAVHPIRSHTRVTNRLLHANLPRGATQPFCHLLLVRSNNNTTYERTKMS